MSGAGRAYVYRFRDAVNGFFEFPTENARSLLPQPLQPIEPHHGRSVLTVTAFDFHDSEVGAYREVILSVLAAPRVLPGEPMPRAAMYPFMVGTSTAAAREHAITLWKLPHLMRDLEIGFDRGGKTVTVTAAAAGKPILELRVTDRGPWREVEHLYQTFARDAEGAWFQTLLLQGPFLEHEEETGGLVLHPHEFHAGVALEDVETQPFREQWMRDGVETLNPLQALAVAR